MEELRNVLYDESELNLYERFAQAIEKYDLLKDIKHILFLFSGGKDATFGLLFLHRYIKSHKLDIQLRGVMVNYPLHVYFDKHGNERSCFKRVKEFWEEKDVQLDILKPDVPDLVEGQEDGCKVCKNVRKELVDNYLNDFEYKEVAAIATGYTIYDVLAYLDEISLVTNYNFDVSNIKDEKRLSRIHQCVHKMQIKEQLPSGYKLIRPIIMFKEDEILQYIKVNKIPYSATPCIVSDFKHKRVYFEVLKVASPINNATYEGVRGFLEKIKIDYDAEYEYVKEKNYFTDC